MPASLWPTAVTAAELVGVPSSPTHQHWSSRLTFLLATIGFSVGLGNIWRFPYLAGESGGGAFVLIYIVCVALIGVPIVMAELAIGRRGGLTPAATMSRIARDEKKSPLWGIAGGFVILTVFLIISYYGVIGGWTLHYVMLGASGALNAVDGETSGSTFNKLLSDPLLLIFWQTVFLGLNVLIVSRGIKRGIEAAVTILMPVLFILLVVLGVYGLIAGDAARGLSFLFRPDFSQVSAKTFLDAIGQAFFSVGVGMGAMMIYGAYLPKSVNIPSTSIVIAFSDTAVALIAGVVVFPFVFAYGVSPAEGPGLVFVTLPAAFAETGAGGIVTTAFFALLAVAAFTSSIALFELLVSWGEEHKWPRLPTALIAAAANWAVGLLTVFSLNRASEYYPLAFLPGYETATMFSAIDRLTSTVGLPLGGMFAALFAGYVMSRASIADELGLDPQGTAFKLWRFIIRWLAPAAIFTLLAAGVQA